MDGGGFGGGAGEVADEVDDEEAAVDFVLEGFEEVAGARGEVFLEDDFVVGGEDAEGGLEDIAVGGEAVALACGGGVEFAADGGDEDDAGGGHGPRELGMSGVL